MVFKRFRIYIESIFVKSNKVSASSQVRQITPGVISQDDAKKDNKIKTSKYSILNFVPKNLAEQFRRAANFYFLIVTIIALVIDSPVSPMTSVVPLVFVVLVTMLKQGYEDWLRHRTDDTVNNQIVEIIQERVVREVRSAQLAPGTLVRVARGRDVPADLVLLCSADERGQCSVTTANLDGETNLKTLRVPPPLVGYTPEILPMNLKLEIPEPTVDLYTFYGRLNIPDQDSVALSTDNIMLRGSMVRNTEWAIGCAVYTGRETKLALNSKYMSNKFTSCEAAINGFLLFFTFILVMEVVCSFVMKRYLESSADKYEYYLGPADSNNSFQSIFQDMSSFLLLYYYIIPISLYVTIELYKFIGSLFIGWDEDLICMETGQAAVANTSDLNEELGQVEILFSDKTGTLTKNLMVFKMCSINGIVYEERNGKLYEYKRNWDEPEDIFKTDIKFFFTILALCHSVQISNDEKKRVSIISANGKFIGMLSPRKQKKSENNNSIFSIDVVEGLPEPRLDYQASSPDEKALVEAADRAQITYLGEDGNTLMLKVGDVTTEHYERLQILEFTSDRKRMSVIVKDKDGKIWLFCKGAESSVLPLCKDSALIEETNKHIDLFANKGLRTLAIAYREIGLEEYDKVSKILTELDAASGTDALKEMGQQYRMLENNLTLIGSTAVEDCLQDDVADTLTSLRNAGINIWVLTGDKVETAINVAQSCAHIPENDYKMFLVNIQTDEACLAQITEYMQLVRDATDKLLTLVVDGSSIAFILGNADKEKMFVEISLACKAVLCCRLSPLQKAQIVKLIKSSPGKPITAAIGDGANDISMIQEAHVGFGIFGKEGRQAARSSDYAIAKFCMIKKVLIVLGTWYYHRLATLIQYFFYKNLVFVNLMLFFQMFSLFSVQSIFDSWYLTLFNLIFASLPCLIHSVTEQSRPEKVLMRQPLWYKKNRKNRLMNWSHFFGTILYGIFHSIVLYFMTLYAVRNDVLNSDGLAVDLWCFGAMLFHLLVVIVNLKLWLQTRYQTTPFVVSVILSILSFPLFNALYSGFYMPALQQDGDVYGTYLRLLRSLAFWSSNLLVAVATLLPDLVIRLTHDELRRRLHPLLPPRQVTRL